MNDPGSLLQQVLVCPTLYLLQINIPSTVLNNNLKSFEGWLRRKF